MIKLVKTSSCLCVVFSLLTIISDIKTLLNVSLMWCMAARFVVFMFCIFFVMKKSINLIVSIHLIVYKTFNCWSKPCFAVYVWYTEPGLLTNSQWEQLLYQPKFYDSSNCAWLRENFENTDFYFSIENLY